MCNDQFMIHAPFEKEAEQMADSIRKLAAKPENLDNFEDYLAWHFAEWLRKWASTTEDMASEFTQFADMEI